MSLLTLKCVEALFLSWESRADVDDNPAGVGATFASGPSQCSAMPVPMQVPVMQVNCTASASGDRIAANASAGAI